MTEVDIEHLRGWIGRTETRSELLTERLLDRFQATLGEQACTDAGAASLAVHWCLCMDAVPAAGLGSDGHPKRGGFLPPVPLPCRMWVGGELEIVSDLRVGETVTRHSRVVDVVAKTGRTGPLVLVTVAHEISAAETVAISERQDIVYREAQQPTAAQASPATAQPSAPRPSAEYSEEINVDPTLLFRYSALTFNGHRIHYDIDYARNVENYRDLVVHAPLQATMLLHLAARLKDERSPKRFSYRGVSPAFANRPLSLKARAVSHGYDLWTADAEGRTSMQASAYW